MAEGRYYLNFWKVLQYNKIQKGCISKYKKYPVLAFIYLNKMAKIRIIGFNR